MWFMAPCFQTSVESGSGIRSDSVSIIAWGWGGVGVAGWGGGGGCSGMFSSTQHQQLLLHGGCV